MKKRILLIIGVMSMMLLAMTVSASAITYPDMTMTTSNATAYMMDKTFTRICTSSKPVEITYSSTDSTIASVDKYSGTVKLLKPGVVRITATSAGTPTYGSTSKSYQLTVSKSSISLFRKDIETITPSYNYNGYGSVTTFKAFTNLKSFSNPYYVNHGKIKYSGKPKFSLVEKVKGDTIDSKTGKIKFSKNGSRVIKIVYPADKYYNERIFYFAVTSKNDPQLRVKLAGKTYKGTTTNYNPIYINDYSNGMVPYSISKAKGTPKNNTPTISNTSYFGLDTITNKLLIKNHNAYITKFSVSITENSDWWGDTVSFYVQEKVSDPVLKKITVSSVDSSGYGTLKAYYTHNNKAGVRRYEASYGSITQHLDRNDKAFKTKTITYSDAYVYSTRTLYLNTYYGLFNSTMYSKSVSNSISFGSSVPVPRFTLTANPYNDPKKNDRYIVNLQNEKTSTGYSYSITLKDGSGNKKSMSLKTFRTEDKKKSNKDKGVLLKKGDKVYITLKYKDPNTNVEYVLNSEIKTRVNAGK